MSSFVLVAIALLSASLVAVAGCSRPGMTTDPQPAAAAGSAAAPQTASSKAPPPHAADVSALAASFDEGPCADLSRCEQLADAGSPKAHFQLGAWHYLGSRLPRDPQAALRHFRAAADGGEVRAQHMLGLAYMTGDMVPPDRTEGGRWLTAAAEAGFPPSQRMLSHFGFAAPEMPATLPQPSIRTAAGTTGEGPGRTAGLPGPVPAGPDLAGSLDPVALFESVEPSVWTVLAAERYRGGIAERSGSAVAVTRHWLFTNCHVVGGADFILIKRRDRIEPARLIHANDQTDRCVLETQTALDPVRRIAPYDRLKVGQTVYSVGSPAGLENTLGPGLVTGLRQWQGVPIIQTNAPISPGSSGGALFDDQGNLIGITTFTVGGNGALGFAVAADSYIQAMMPDARG